jgi:hypothetical protein
MIDYCQGDYQNDFRRREMDIYTDAKKNVLEHAGRAIRSRAERIAWLASCAPRESRGKEIEHLAAELLLSAQEYAQLAENLYPDHAFDPGKFLDDLKN